MPIPTALCIFARPQPLPAPAAAAATARLAPDNDKHNHPAAAVYWSEHDEAPLSNQERARRMPAIARRRSSREPVASADSPSQSQEHSRDMARSCSSSSSSSADVVPAESSYDSSSSSSSSSASSIFRYKSQASDRLRLLYAAPPPSPPDPKTSCKEQPVTWLSLPSKPQLLVLAICRLSEPLTQTSVLSYLYYLLRSFHPPDLPPPSAATISRQAGLLASCFAGSQCLTGLLWGRLSDRIGRKPCILLGLAGTTLSVIGFGFSDNLGTALAFRILGGCLNGNVGVLRTMVSEVVTEKKYQSRAFIIMPMCFNIGIIVGPILGGLLADPAENYPDLFGKVEWMIRWKYALPNLVSACFLATSWTLGFLFLQETLEAKKGRRDIGREIGSAITRSLRRFQNHIRQKWAESHNQDGKGVYTTVAEDGTCYDDSNLANKSPEELATKPDSLVQVVEPKRIPFRDSFTPNIISTLIAFTILPLHNATFMHLWSIFLSTPRVFLPSIASSLPLFFSGGLGLPAHQVGLAMSYLGIIGISIQLMIYPPLQAKLGLLFSFRLSTLIFPVTYFLTPFLSLLPSTSPPPAPASGVIVWVGIATILLLQVTARTFALPGSVILLTNSVERREVLGTVHGVGSSLASFSRALGPICSGWLYAACLEGGVVMGVFWGMACVAGVGAGWGWFIKEGKGICQPEDDDASPHHKQDATVRGAHNCEETPLLLGDERRSGGYGGAGRS